MNVPAAVVEIEVSTSSPPSEKNFVSFETLEGA